MVFYEIIYQLQKKISMMPVGIYVKERCRYYKKDDFPLPHKDFRVEI